MEPSSSSYRPPRRPLLKSLLLAASLLLLSAPTPSTASTSSQPSATPAPPHLRSPPSLLSPGTIPIQLPFLEPLEWPATTNEEEEELELEEDRAGGPGKPRSVPEQQHSYPFRLPSPSSTRKRGRALCERQETEQDEAAGGETSTAAETAVATVEASINPSTSGNPLAVASATDSLSFSTPTPTSSAPAAATTTSKGKGKVAPAVPTPAAAVPNPFPQPFDLTLNLNLTSTCLDYFAYFLSSQSFQACRAFSLLFSSSSAFSSIASQDNLTDITAVVQATLNSSSTCESLMVGMGTTLADRCKTDLVAGVPIAKEALTGFQTFAMMKEASALVSSDSGAYCYVEALASDEPADLFLWNLYTGAALPNTSLPSCSSCTKNLFSVYETYASNASLALTVSYSSAVELSNTQCGSSFATTVVATSSGFPTFSTTRRSTFAAALLGLIALSFPL